MLFRPQVFLAAAFTALLGLAPSAPAQAQAPVNPILFVTQVPVLGDFAARASTFANHGSRPTEVARGGDLMIRYPNGTLRNLTQEAGFGMAGLQGNNAIAVREPSVHWSGTKAVFSMIVGAPPVQFNYTTYYWQLYEVTGLGQGQQAVITKVANQPTTYNNVAPLYGTDERIIFASDRPFNGAAHLYPQLDEYESTATVTGLFSLNPATGDLKLLNHTPSGAFSPTLDSFGRVIFTRWDHLQRDQQADADSETPTFGSFNFASEAPGAAQLASRAEVFPEPRGDSVSATHGPVNGHRFNQFTPWMINEDGTDEETLNHIGRHELSFGYLIKSFASDAALSDYTIGANQPSQRLHANTISVGMDTGLFQLREDPTQPGMYFTTFTREFATLATGQLLRLNGGPAVNPNAMALVPQTAPIEGNYAGGRFRNPLPMSNGGLVATHTNVSSASPELMTDFRLKSLVKNVTTGFYEAGAPLTGGIAKNVSWWTPDNLETFSGNLWELEAVEVVARPKPQRGAQALDTPEASVFAEEGVNEAAFKAWLNQNNLALIVTRNHTSRDKGDQLQPFNLRVPGGVQTTSGNGKVYDISHFQILQGDMIRGYTSRSEGRRILGQPLHSTDKNPANPGGPAGSVKIAADGSSAAYVPARRALAWQTTSATGEPVVRERVWVTFQPGEVRVCASCHGLNAKSQANTDVPANKPEALRTLLQAWKQMTQQPPPAARVDVTWRNDTSGALYLQNVATPASSGYVTPSAIQLDAQWKVAALADLDGNGQKDVVLRDDATGEVYGLKLNGTAVASEAPIYLEPNPAWKIVGAGDFNGDGKADLLWHNNQTGDVFMLLMVNGNPTGGGVVYSEPNQNWRIQKVADFNGDGKADILWRNTATGDVFMMLMNGTTVIGGGVIYSEPNANWQIQTAADFNGDGRADIVWRNVATGDVFMMLMNGTAVIGGSVFYGEPNLAWQIVGAQDHTGDGKADLLWRHTATGQVYLMTMNGTTMTGGSFIYTEPDLAWKIVGP